MSWIPKWLTGGIDVAEEEKRAKELDSQLATLNAEALSSGLWSQEQFDHAEMNRQASTGDTDYGSQVLDAFRQGAAEGLAAELDYSAQAVKTTLNTPAKWLWQAIPWWVWLGGAVGLFVYLGGGTWLRGALAKR